MTDSPRTLGIFHCINWFIHGLWRMLILWIMSFKASSSHAILKLTHCHFHFISQLCTFLETILDTLAVLPHFIKFVGDAISHSKSAKILKSYSYHLVNSFFNNLLHLSCKQWHNQKFSLCMFICITPQFGFWAKLALFCRHARISSIEQYDYDRGNKFIQVRLIWLTI